MTSSPSRLAARLGLTARLGLAAYLVAGLAGCEGSKAAIDGAADETRAAADAAKRSANQAADETRAAADAAKRSANQAVDDTRAAADAARRSANQAVDDTRDAVQGSAGALSARAKDLAQKTGDASAALWADVPSTGELSDAARSALAASHDQAAALIAGGAQLAPTAIALAKALNRAIDHETRIEPIYQVVDARGQAAVDASIADMPRVEVIDGLRIGFREMSELRTDRHLQERGYLVLWRRGDHVIGVVYRSRRAIDLEALIREVPGMLAAIRGVTG
ncbi:MAG: hypothetical protein R3B09_02435 [Nannocystaceae bacterium]